MHKELQDRLISLIEDTVHLKLSPEAFEKSFYMQFMDTNEDAFDETYEELFSLICERLDMTAKKPSKSDRGFGWINYAEFLSWLQQKYADFIQTHYV